MNLATTIELQSGGAGSGCRGDNCGRKKGSAEDRKLEKLSGGMHNRYFDKTLYHVTTYDNAKKIVKEGIKPSRGTTEEGGREDTRNKYVWTYNNPMEAIGHGMYGIGFDETQVAIVHINQKEYSSKKWSGAKFISVIKDKVKPKDLKVELYNSDQLYDTDKKHTELRPVKVL